MAEQLATQKDIQELSKNLSNLNMTMGDIKRQAKNNPMSSNASLQTIGAKETDRFVRKEDTAKKFYKDSVATLKEILKVNKDMLRQSIGKFSTGLGSMLALGGLVGYLLTGKTSMLTAAVKGLEKAFVLPVAKIMDKMVMKSASFLLKNGKNLIKDITIHAGEKVFNIGGKLMDKMPKLAKLGEKLANVGGKVAGVGYKMIPKAAEVGTEIGVDVLKTATKTAEKVGIKGLLKGGSKLGLKALAKIPVLGWVLGPVVGIIFAWQKFKKKDYVGGLLELASGFASMIPVLGIPISLAIDVFTLFRDLKMPKETATPPANNQTPFKPKKGIFNSMFGGLGEMLVPGMSNKDKGDADFDALMNPMKKKTNTTIPSSFKPVNYNLPVTPESLMAMRKYTPSDATMTQGSKGNPFYFYHGAKLQRMKPRVMSNFQKMAEEYYAMTGQKLQVNSGYRSYEEQKALYQLYKSQGREQYASNPDGPDGKPRPITSPHMLGVAADIQGTAADLLEQTGVMAKYGFARPLMGRSGQPQSVIEPWHVQARPSIIGDANVTNPSAIDSHTFASNMEKLNSSIKSDGMKELIEVTREANKLLVKTIQGQKMTSHQSISVNSAG